MKSAFLVATGLAMAVSLPASAQTAEEAATACADAVQMINDEDFDGALEEAKWCVESLQQIKQQAMLAVFPDEVLEFAGGELSNQSAMGMTMLERSYSNAQSEVNVSLTTGMAGGGLAALAQLGMGMNAGGGKKMRIQKRTVLDLSQPGEGQYMVQLKSGGSLAISSNDLNAEQLLPFVKAFPIANLDEALSP